MADLLPANYRSPAHYRIANITWAGIALVKVTSGCNPPLYYSRENLFLNGRRGGSYNFGAILGTMKRILQNIKGDAWPIKRH